MVKIYFHKKGHKIDRYKWWGTRLITRRMFRTAGWSVAARIRGHGVLLAVCLRSQHPHHRLIQMIHIDG